MPADSPTPADPPQQPPKKKPRHLFLYVDGAASGNPGPAGAAALIKDAEGDTLLEKARAFGPATNNVAEYQGLLLGLELAAQLKPNVLTIRSDSELLVRQVAGQYKVRAPHLKPLLREVKRLLAPFETVEIEHIPRTQNAEADKLARKALEKARKVDAELPPEARKSPRTKKFKLKG
jgi:ribonuclease HI